MTGPATEQAPVVPGQRTGTGLPPDLPALLRRAFDTDTSHRLPRLRSAVGVPDWDDADHGVALRDAHTIATSAVVVGLPCAARAARAAEDALRAWRDGDPAGRAAYAEAVGELDVALTAG